MLPRSWKPTATRLLTRLGPQDDGGYTFPAPALEEADVLLSCGMFDDWRFERNFLQRIGSQVLCVDGTVTRGFWIRHAAYHFFSGRVKRAFQFLDYLRFFRRPGVEHRRLMVGYDSPGTVSLGSLLREFAGQRVILKLDIEGAEYRTFDDIIRHAEQFNAIAMELHDVDLHRDRITALIRALPQFKVIDLRPNNFGAADPAGDPTIVQMTLAHRRFVLEGSPGDSVAPFPPNDPSKPDIVLRFETDDAAGVALGDRVRE